ncbi:MULTISPECIES: SIR2 family protein [unclassified Lysinibacillus]|uniref:SIR2 family protein n=1 Tax=unclassified Lysinibacillus TaxID=2636778 RepID=UPI0038055C26
MNSQIIEAIKRDQLVFFIGSGFSLPLEYPDWNGLVENMLEILSKDYQQLLPLRDIIKAEVPLMSTIDLLDYLVNYKDRVYKIMDHEFAAIEDKVKQNPHLLKKHEMIGKITSKIITTNYDKSLEQANPEFKKITYLNQFNIANLHNVNEYIFKIHGCIEDAARCVLYKEDYEKLYSDESEFKGAIEELRKIIGDKTIIFLGFSLSDPYVKYQFDYINTIYRQLKGKHFLISTENKSEIEGVETLKIDDWDKGLDSLLEELYRIKKETVQNEIVLSPKPSDEITKINTINIAILIANPINERLDFSINKIIKPFNNWDVKIDYFNLNVKNLNKLEGYQYIFLFASAIRNNVIIEDEYLMAHRITLEKLQNEILDDTVKCTFIFTYKKHNFDTTNIYLPIIINQFENQYDSFIFKTLKKGMLHNENNNLETQIINDSQIVIEKLVKGIHKVNYIKTPLPSEIDSKQLINFVGRLNDLENIIRKILDIDGKILNIKGSGGVGKTTIIKKVLIEIAQRGLYTDGIHFVDCQPIKDYESFKFKISQCYKLDNTLDLKEHMLQNNVGNDKLIIIDNFESLLDLDDSQEIIQLVSFLCDYANVVCTSREWLNFEFEEKYELRQLTTDECVELFQKYYSYRINEEEMKILRNDIIENLLNNNPLAIKIVTSIIPKLKSMSAIKKDLEEDFFNATKLGYDDIFSSSEDLNIEKSKSLFQSINYSYCKLLSKEKLVFELISLFPNGIHMDNFLNVFKNSKNGMTGKELKSLEDKSLIQISNTRISLQSIIGRFASHKFSERGYEEKKHYYDKAIDYNIFTMSIIMSDSLRNKDTIELYENNIENYRHSLEYLDQVNSYSKLELLRYLWNVASFSSNISKSEKFIKDIKRLKDLFKEIEDVDKALDIFICSLKYIAGDFEGSLSNMKKMITLEEAIEMAGTDDLVENIICNSAISVYRYGNEWELINYCKINKGLMRYELHSMLFNIGAYRILEENLLHREGESFFEFEILNNLGKLDINVIDKCLSEQIHNNEHLEIMQINYIKAKMGIISREEVKKLVVVNPYSLGIKNLMFAFLETDLDKTIEYYERAIVYLKHIKYYYVEAMYYYTKHLKENGLEEYNNLRIKGRNTAEKYHYSFLIYKFDCLLNDLDIPYNEDEYSINIDFDWTEYSSTPSLKNNRRIMSTV